MFNEKLYLYFVESLVVLEKYCLLICVSLCTQEQVFNGTRGAYSHYLSLLKHNHLIISPDSKTPSKRCLSLRVFLAENSAFTIMLNITCISFIMSISSHLFNLYLLECRTETPFYILPHRPQQQWVDNSINWYQGLNTPP